MPFIGAIDSGETPAPGRNVSSGNDAPSPVLAQPTPTTSGGGIDSGGIPRPGQILPGSFTPPIVPNALSGGPTGPTGPAGPPLAFTVARLTNVSPQYTVLSTDGLIEANVTGGALVAPILFDLSPFVGEPHTVKALGNAAAAPVLVNGNGNLIENPQSPGTFTLGSVAIAIQGGAVTWVWDGTRWNIQSSA